jgi:FlaA1/EpsC-like NDP-sugar epimerase
MKTVNIDSFIAKNITKRDGSFFERDILGHSEFLTDQIKGKSVLVIGGGGTIGSNYIKSVLRFRPGRIVVVDTNENSLTELVRDVRSTKGLFVPKEFITYPVNLGDKIFEKIYEYYKPFDIIANFAAHKHVRSEKDIFSIEAMIKNNLFNAYTLLNLIETDKPLHFFCVSTDKAANPVNIMGATKKLMEELVLQYSSVIKTTTARFANVAFSNGSLLDGFLHRTMRQHPLSVPADIKRYFVSPAESGDICMLASILGSTGDIFFPKLMVDELTSFYEITEKFLAELGYEMDLCSSEEEAKDKSMQIGNSNRYPVYAFNSDTTGEKLYEEFYTETELVDWESYEALAVAKSPKDIGSGTNLRAIKDLTELFKRPNVEKRDIVEILTRHISTFGHIEKGITLDLKM